MSDTKIPNSVPVDLGQDFGKEPTLPGQDEGSDKADSISQSPLSMSRGGADPTHIGPDAPYRGY